MLCWVFVSVRGLSLVVASGDHSSSWCAGLSLSRPFPLRSTGSRRAGSAIVAHGHSCSAACGIFPDQGSNRCPLHWQADSQPLRHQGSPLIFTKWVTTKLSNVVAWIHPLTNSTQVPVAPRLTQYFSKCFAVFLFVLGFLFLLLLLFFSVFTSLMGIKWYLVSCNLHFPDY